MTHYRVSRKGMGGRPPAVLRPEEAPLPLRPLLDFSSQRTEEQRLRIQRQCAKCGKVRWLKVGSLRNRIRNRPLETLLICQCCGAKAANKCGAANPNWRGGRRKHGDGYIELHLGSGEYILEHRLVMAQKLGRPLWAHETVHHINGDRADNRPENLELWQGGQPTGVRAAQAHHCPGCRCFGGE